MHLLVLVLTICTLIAAQQLTCTLGCIQCDSISTVCFACGNNYELTLQGECVSAKISSCSLYLNQQQCIQCYPTYNLVNNTCQRDYSGCIQNISSARCGRCVPELLNNNGVCLGIFNCQAYSGSSCSKCQSGFTLKNQICVSSAENCEVVDLGSGICKKCLSNYSLVGYKCILNQISSQNCYLYDEKGNCYACKRGYLLNGTLCNLQNQLGNVQIQAQPTPLPPPPPPVTTNPANNFSNGQVNSAGGAQIIANNTPTQNATSPPSAQTTATNTSVANNLITIMNKLNIYCSKFQNGTCIECYPSYYLKDGTCTPISPLCQKFNNKTNLCENCYPGYQLNSNATCVISVVIPKDPYCKDYNNSKCIGCYSRFILSPLGACQPSNPICKQINADGSCKSCYNGYIISGITCIINQTSAAIQNDPLCLSQVDKKCASCVNGYFLLNSSGKCVPLSLNCLSNDLQTGLCTQCLPLLILVNGSCIVPIDKCIQYSNNSCIQCTSQAYYLKNGLCYNKDVTCGEYDTQGNCKTCVTTYFLVNGACIFPALGFDPLCNNYLNGYCTVCKSGSYLSNYACQQIDQNCVSFDYQKSICLQCSPGYSPQGGSCTLIS